MKKRKKKTKRPAEYTVLDGKRYDGNGKRVFARTPEQRQQMGISQRLRWARYHGEAK